MVIAVLIVLGLVFGSFVNALVWRLHEKSSLLRTKSQKSRQQRLKQLSVWRGRSMCPTCGHELAAKDLVPVLSWLSLRGKCRYCKVSISWQYPVVELATAALFIVSYACWPVALAGVGLFQFVLWLVFLIGFMALAVYDLRWMLLPDKLVLPLIGLAVVEVIVVALWQQDWSALWQPAVGAAIIGGLFYVLFQVSDGRWIGGGDVKLGIVLGLLAATPLRALLVIFFASLLGTLVSLPLFARPKRALATRIPFGPFLMLATVIVQLFGNNIVHWYSGLFV